MRVPWSVHRIGSMYASGVSTQVQNQWVRAVAEPYASNVFERMRAAWWVMTGKAEAILWPRPGDFEQATTEKPYVPSKPSGRERLITAGARVEVVVEVSHCGSWGDTCAVSQIHRQAAEEAIGYIQNRTQRDRRLRIIGSPRVISVSSERDR